MVRCGSPLTEGLEKTPTVSTLLRQGVGLGGLVKVVRQKGFATHTCSAPAFEVCCTQTIGSSRFKDSNPKCRGTFPARFTERLYQTPKTGAGRDS